MGEDFSGLEDSHFINGLTLSRRISSHFDLGLSALWGEYEGHYYDEYYCEDMALVRDLTLFNLNAKFHLFKYDDVLVRPFVFAGFGLLVFDDEDFESGNSNINKTSKSILNSIVDVLKKNPNYKLDIKGYTDTDGDENMNLRLSDSRAKIVKKYLTKRGISDKRLFTKGYGEQNPIADNNTEEGKAKNRRVELNLN